ncbi:MAG: helix-turn-helix transcriptional regulator [Fimbriimonadaceae bacterium]|nr:helix-turn-helix transcriptional regulator [Alphaproteobacteria bacterium]
MKKISFDGRNCSVARSLDLIGEWWTLLIILEAFFGTRRFSDFEKNLGISKNVLTERLQKLVANGILRRMPDDGGKRQIYRLTDMGRELFPVIAAMMQWGDKWIMGKEQAPVRLMDKETGEEIAPLAVLSRQGRPLRPRDISMEPNENLPPGMKTRFKGTK